MITWPEVLKLARQANDHYSLTEREQELVWELANTIPEGRMIVELGLCHGKTSIILTGAAKNKNGFFCGIDNFSLEGSKAALEELLTNSYGPAKNLWIIHQADTHDKKWSWEPSELADMDPEDMVDFLLIDAGHDEENVRQDCEVWIPQVRPGGLVLFDDVASGPTWRTDCHSAVRFNMEKWCGDWDHAASFGKLWCWRKPL